MSQRAPFALNQEDDWEFYTQEPDAAPGPPMSKKEMAVIADAYADSDGASSHTEVDEVQYGMDDRAAGFRAAQSAMERAAEEERAGRMAAREAIAKRQRVQPEEEEDPLSVYFGNVPLIRFGDLDTSGQELVRARAQYRAVDPNEDVNTFGFLCNDCAIDGMPDKKGTYPAPGQLLFPLPMMEADDAAKYIALIKSVHGAGVVVPMEALVALEPPENKKVTTRAAYTANVAVGFNQIQRGQRTFVELYAPNAGPMEEERAPARPPAMSAPLRVAASVAVGPVYQRKRLGLPVTEGRVHTFDAEDMGVKPDLLTKKERAAKQAALMRKAMRRRPASEKYPDEED